MSNGVTPVAILGSDDFDVAYVDLSFLDFGGSDEGSERLYPAPAADPSAGASDAARATSRRVEGIGGVGEGNRTPDLQNHNLAL